MSAKVIFDIVIVKKAFLYGFTERIKDMGTEYLKQAQETVEPEAQASAIQHEDVTLKTAFRYFADVLLPYFGIKGKAVSIAATELVHLDVKVFHEDPKADGGIYRGREYIPHRPDYNAEPQCGPGDQGASGEAGMRRGTYEGGSGSADALPVDGRGYVPEGQGGGSVPDHTGCRFCRAG